MIESSGQEFDDLRSLDDDLKFVLIVSAASVTAAPTTGVPRNVKVMKTAHAKCERCWHRRADVGSDPAHPTICARCVTNLTGPGEARRFA